MIEFKYSVGDKIEARDPASNEWRPAVVTKLKPYRGHPGYDCIWDPLPKDYSSIGGWQYERTMRIRHPTKNN